ncbi:GntR family transcriptional regulator [Streptomyces sp. WAC 01529]|uniref:GntR family transcriptional regulator n=1 Tax=Streptomyces sp. WAC 01529 TaxID=2203205 RepID=UPI000F6CEF1D|nr:GntR family transcriptional regulator [Streptomyces sp. WAC 01529]AZM51742.1 GntR family transcriptional regulator [Streptomyces sp. WAC 01529]
MALPKYDQIAADLRGRIVRGELAAGDALPSERELTERWGVARATVVRALDVLRQEALIETKQGTGSLVRERTALARTAGERYAKAATTGTIYTAGEYAEILAAEKASAPEDVATALDVDAGATVVRRHRVTYEGDTPVATSQSWFTADVGEAAPRLLQRERIQEGTTRYAERETGRRAHTGRSWWTARLATEAEREQLRLEEPAAVREERHITYDTEGRALAYEVDISPGGRWTRTEEFSMSE